MRSKEEAFAFAMGQFDVVAPTEKCNKWHYGRIDLKALLDFIYDEQCIEEEESSD